MLMSTLMPWRSKAKDDNGASTALSRLHDEVDHLFGRFFEDAFGAPMGVTGAMEWAPLLDVDETDDEIRVSAEIPGIDPKEFDISVTGNVLTISGEKKVERKEDEKEGDYRLYERRYGRFERSFVLPRHVDQEHVDARLQDGVLTVTLPKVEAAKPRKIAISGEGRQITSGEES